MDSTQITYDYLVPSFMSALNHPLTFARTLMLLGYEPFPPFRRFSLRNIFQPDYEAYYYPNVFTYCHKLRKEVGLYNVFTIGLPASIVGSFVKSYSTDRIMEHLTPDFYEKKTFFETERGMKKFLISTGKVTVARVVSTILSYPFQVVMIRQMSQFISRTHIYDCIFVAFPSIVKHEGLFSFFSGLTPKLIGEVITVWLTACLAYLLNKYIFTNHVDPSLKKHTPFVTGVLVAGTTHGLTVTSTVMAARDSRWGMVGIPDPLAENRLLKLYESHQMDDWWKSNYYPVLLSFVYLLTFVIFLLVMNIVPTFNNWWQCYSYLNQSDAFVRGSSLFFRRAPAPVAKLYGYSY